jgi:hypothetical protein
MTISKEHLETAIEGLTILVKRNEKGLEMIRENEEWDRTHPAFVLKFADPVDQQKSDREAIEHERDLHDKIARRKAALCTFKANLNG